MDRRPRKALRKSDTPPDMIMRKRKADNILNHSPLNANQISLIERNKPITTTRNPKVPIKNRKIGPMEISWVLNIVISQTPSGLRSRTMALGWVWILIGRKNNL
jgi:hypothetical protein